MPVTHRVLAVLCCCSLQKHLQEPLWDRHMQKTQTNLNLTTERPTSQHPWVETQAERNLIQGLKHYKVREIIAQT